MTFPARTERLRRERRRWVVLVVLGAVLAVLAVASSPGSSAPPAAVAPSAGAVSVRTESSSLFCGGLEHVVGSISSTVTIADLAGGARTLEVTTSNERGRVSLRLVGVRPGHVLRLDPSHLLAGSDEAMAIVADGGGVVASESVSGAGGTAVAPCLTEAAPAWYLTGGSTQTGRSLLISVLNPYEVPAQVTVSFLTPGGFVEPGRFKGLDIGPHRLDVLVVHDVAPSRSMITTDVQATTGSVVVYGVERATSGAASVSVLPGAPATASSAVFPITPNATGASTSLLVANVGTTPLTASVQTAWAPGCGTHCSAPFSLGVGPGETTSLQVAPSSRVPIGVVAAAELSATPPGLVVVQTVTTSSTVGQSAALDDPSQSGSVRLVLVDPSRTRFERVSIVNPAAAPASVTLETVGPHGVRVHRTVLVAGRGVTVVNGRRLGWLVGGVLELVATAPIYAAGEVRNALLGSDLLIAVPVS